MGKEYKIIKGDSMREENKCDMCNSYLSYVPAMKIVKDEYKNMCIFCYRTKDIEKASKEMLHTNFVGNAILEELVCQIGDLKCRLV